MTADQSAIGGPQRSRTRSLIELDLFEIRDCAPVSGDPLELAGEDSAGWTPALVPGGVHESLIAAGTLSDPRVGGHELDAAWIEEREWWYRARFSTPERDGAETVRLVFDGLDTITDIWLDDALLGHHENQFTPASFDITEALTVDAEREHVLLLRFTPPLPSQPAEGEEPEGNGPRGPMRRVRHLRKAAFSWGWDFGPRLPSIGIWKPVRLEVGGGTRVTGHRVTLVDLARDHSRATVRMRAEIEQASADETSVWFALTAPDGKRYEVQTAVRAGIAEADLALENPQLWWTHDLGTPARHTFEVALSSGGVPLLEDRIGLRMIELDRSPEPVEGGRLFQFVLNGVPLFARGANWVPPSPFVGTADAALIRDRVLRAREGNLTMLRVWGGGVYEHDSFYRACDELGVLVWQDFMFACVDYPGDSDVFRAEVEAEARAQVARLRNHACLALWCGNNEVEIINLIRNGGRESGDWGRRIFHEVLPAVVDELDGSVEYWPGSPWGDGGPEAINGVLDGDRHDWEVWHGLVVPGLTLGDASYPSSGDARHYRRYADDTGRFVSEFGILSAPDRTTLDRWMPGVALHDTVFDRHVGDRPTRKGDELFAVTTGIPADLDEYIDLSQAVQAEAMLFAMEHFRRRQPRTAGALIWQFEDTWPAMSWSLVDVDGVPKSAYYAVARAAAPLAVSWRAAENHGVELWLVNNTIATATVDIEIELGTFQGTERTSVRVRGTAASGSSNQVWSGQVAYDTAHFAWASSPDGLFPPARKHFAELGELELGTGRVDATVVDGGLEIVSTGYSYGVRISHPIPAMRLTDNCFDLRDGERRTIGVSGADPATLSVRSTIPRARDSLKGMA